MSTSLHPYLNFDGNTAEAMTFYAAALGGSLNIIRMGDSPVPVDEASKDRVMHATVSTPGIRLMASDTMYGMTVSPGNSVHLSLNFTDPAEQEAVWGRLSEGATITMPLSQQFFGRFGMLVDRFGMSWMLHYETPHGAQS